MIGVDTIPYYLFLSQKQIEQLKKYQKDIKRENEKKNLNDFTNNQL